MKYYNYNALKKEIKNNSNDLSFILSQNSSFNPAKLTIVDQEQGVDENSRICIFETIEDVDKFDGTVVDDKIKVLKENSDKVYIHCLNDFAADYEVYLKNYATKDELHYFESLPQEYKQQEINKYYDIELKNMLLAEEQKRIFKSAKELDESKFSDIWLVINPDVYDNLVISTDEILAVTTNKVVADNIASRLGEFCYTRKLVGAMVSDRNFDSVYANT